MICPLCENRRGLPANGEVWVRCPACEALVFCSNGGPRVLLGHESDELAVQLGTVLYQAGFQPLRAANGSQVLQLLAAHRPRAVVLDVAIPEVMSFQIVEYVRGHAELGQTKIVLVASVFNAAAYKRRPHTLYGADDYVEQHHIPDMLPKKLSRLLGTPLPSSAGPPPTTIANAPETAMASAHAGYDGVLAVARAIIADIALYNETEFLAYVTTRNLEPLHAALTEGRRLLAEQVAPERYAGRDPVLEAFHHFLKELESRGS